ncbi:serine hydrolase domain-containing protein [Phenylobacterium sp.]|uniref:serine hydrolase domain-containing protein n=1 Tax=Phenylobacterium sp. TaxID=1871053 RepID=UPI0028A1B224|nr:serine hydrolase domain-containing protein [Phenylobacterium sp.]
MRLDRRTLLAAAAAATLPGPAAAARPKKKPAPRCKGRVAYAGPPLRAPLAAGALEAAARAGAARLQPVIDDGLEARLERAAGQMQVQALGAALARPDGSLWTQTHAAAGPPPSRFFWASVGKAYTASAILQMVEEGKLALDAPVGRWAPNLPNAAHVTIEDLLAHTSGLYSFQEDAGLRADPGYKSPETLLNVAAAHPALFCPGAAWSYSNTGYVLLGRIMEAVDGKPYDQALTGRIVERLELRETTILAPRQVPADMAPPAGAETEDLTTPYAAGAVAASAADVVRFWRALMSNRLHGAQATAGRLARLYPMAGVSPASFYGQGMMVSDLALADPAASDTWIGHAGGLPGAKAMVAYSLEKQAYVAVALTGEGSPEATANLLLSGLPKKA